MSETFTVDLDTGKITLPTEQEEEKEGNQKGNQKGNHATLEVKE